MMWAAHNMAWHTKKHDASPMHQVIIRVIYMSVNHVSDLLRTYGSSRCALSPLSFTSKASVRGSQSSTPYCTSAACSTRGAPKASRQPSWELGMVLVREDYRDHGEENPLSAPMFVLYITT